jgi:hypothetical protein
MIESGKWIQVDGCTTTWEPSGDSVYWNGLCLIWKGGLNVVPLPCEPTDHEKTLIMAAYERGYEDGKQAGRRILQNEFRNLMDCQK